MPKSVDTFCIPVLNTSKIVFARPTHSTRIEQLVPSRRDKEILKIVGKKLFSCGVQEPLKKIYPDRILKLG
jgi:hypothetical protein